MDDRTIGMALSLTDATVKFAKLLSKPRGLLFWMSSLKLKHSDVGRKGVAQERKAAREQKVIRRGCKI